MNRPVSPRDTTEPGGGATRSEAPDEAARLMRRATYASVTTAAVLIAVKLVAWIYTDSVSLLTSLMDSVLDAIASALNLLAVRHALTPADREHRFGHGKAEALAALGQATFISGSALFILFVAVQRILTPVALGYTGLGIAVLVFSIAATFVLTRYQAHVIRKTGSVAIQADSLHYVGDLLMNGAVIVALLLVGQLGWFWADPVFGLGIAAYILVNAWRIAREALNVLMDRELPDEERARIREIVQAHPAVIDMHDLRTRTSGRDTFIQIHLELDGTLSLVQSHRITEEVEARLHEAFPDAEVIIHQDPYGIKEPRARFG